MAYTIVKRKVNGFAVWKKAFDDFESTRKANGEKSAVVLQTDGDPNEVSVINSWDSIATAKSFLEAPALRETMEAAGVAQGGRVLLRQRSIALSALPGTHQEGGSRNLPLFVGQAGKPPREEPDGDSPCGTGRR